MKNLALIIKNILSKLLTEYAIPLTFSTYAKSQWVNCSRNKLRNYCWEETDEYNGSLPTAPVRISKINRQHALPADFSEVPFETFIICDNLYQGYLQTQDDNLLDQLGSTLYGKSMTFKPYERINIFYWFAALKEILFL